MLCHRTLRDKLKLYHFTDNTVTWLMSYLQDRSQCVRVESKTSDFLDCDNFGIPQGSLLGGLLHVINCNDFPACHQEGESVLYVDDDSDVVSDSDINTLRDKIETEAGLSAQLLKDNRLCVAAHKSKLIVTGTQQLRSLNVTVKIQCP